MDKLSSIVTWLIAITISMGKMYTSNLVDSDYNRYEEAAQYRVYNNLNKITIRYYQKHEWGSASKGIRCHLACPGNAKKSEKIDHTLAAYMS